MSGSARTRQAQAWIELRADDPAAVSALGVARARLAAGRGLRGLRRFRVIELQGALPGSEALQVHLHESTWFYNPHKESCLLRTAERDPAPGAPGVETILVVERGSPRRAAAERWWRHETGRRIAVREAVAWVLEFAPGTDAASSAESLMTVRDQVHGLFANPHAEAAARASGTIPLAWITAAEEDAS
jgi:hypothetical protein